MEKLEITIEREIYDPFLTLYPSFNYALINTVRDRFVFTCGKLKGASFWVRERTIRYRGMGLETLLDVSGLWYDAEYEARRLGRNDKRLFEELFSVYRGLSLSINRVDKALILTASYLSRNTSFHNNVVRWMKYLCRCGLYKECIDSAHGKFHSYQLLGLHDALAEFRRLRKSSGALGTLGLLMKRNIGIKVLLAFLVFTTRGGKRYAPPDINYINMVKRLGIFDKFSMPSKELCINHLAEGCARCPRKSSCIVALSANRYKGLAAWIQTAFYVHAKLYCRGKLCKGCPLRDRCLYPFTPLLYRSGQRLF